MRAGFEESDEGILALARQGRDGVRRAAAAALRRYLRELYRHVRSRLPEDEVAVEDVLQEVALAVVEGLPRVRESAALRPWLLRVATHKVADHIRRRSRDRAALRAEMGQAVTSQLVDEEGSIERLIERAGEEQLAAYLRCALDQLRPRHREAVTMVYFEGLTLEEASARLGIRADAMAALLYRARRAFGKIVDRDRRVGPARDVAYSPAQVLRKC